MVPSAKTKITSAVWFALLACLGSGCHVTAHHLERYRSPMSRMFPYRDSGPPPAKRCVKDPCFHGYQATCWTPWPSGWTGCPPCAVRDGIDVEIIGEVEPGEDGPNGGAIPSPAATPRDPLPFGPMVPVPVEPGATLPADPGYLLPDAPGSPFLPDEPGNPADDASDDSAPGTPDESPSDASGDSVPDIPLPGALEQSVPLPPAPADLKIVPEAGGAFDNGKEEEMPLPPARDEVDPKSSVPDEIGTMRAAEVNDATPPKREGFPEEPIPATPDDSKPEPTLAPPREAPLPDARSPDARSPDAQQPTLAPPRQSTLRFVPSSVREVIFTCRVDSGPGADKIEVITLIAGESEDNHRQRDSAPDCHGGR